MRFFPDEVMEHRLPRTMLEGALKGLFLAAMIMSAYDNFTEMPTTHEGLIARGKTIVGGYLLFTLIGTFLGFIGQLENQPVMRHLRR